MVDDSIIQKIQKCLKLAEGNTNENEREQAMERASTLMAEHNLQMSEVQGVSFEEKPEEATFDLKVETWVSQILSGVCELFFTAIFTRSKYEQGRANRVKRYVLVGTIVNMTGTTQMAKYLVDSVRAEANRLYSSAKDRKSFCLGAAVSIKRRANALAEEQRRPPVASTTGTSLMVVRNSLERANQEYLDQQNMRKCRQRSQTVTDAVHHGEAYGNRISLNKQVGVAAPKQIG